MAKGIKAGLEATSGLVKRLKNKDILFHVFFYCFFISREDLFITSKLWAHKLHPADVEGLLRETMSNLGLDYVDLYLIHVPFAFARGDDPVPKDDKGNVIVSTLF